MDASRLHPWAWESGASFWRTGHFVQAVMQAAIRVNAETQGKSWPDGRLGDRPVQPSLLTRPAQNPGHPRLRIVPDDGSTTYKIIHRGARAFAEGLYTAIRNPGMHTPAKV